MGKIGNDIRLLGMQKYCMVLFVCAWLPGIPGVFGQCTQDSQAEMLQRKELFKKFYVAGNPIPNVQLDTIAVHGLTATTNMVVFWKPDCPYCKNLLAVADSLLQKYNAGQLQVLAICLDHDKAEWQNHPFVQKRYSNLHQYCDGRGYSGEAAVAYHVFATPTMLLFNRKHELMALPKSVKELEGLILQTVVADGR